MTTARELIERGARDFERAGLHFGHGTDNAVDEAAFLVLHALGLPPDADAATLARALDPAAAGRARRLVDERIASRRPAAYLTKRMWFAGHEFHVDPRVLVPRSPFAELIVRSFQPWLGERSVGSVLDIGTGSGCIAVATALAFPGAVVDATDVSTDALDVAHINRARHGLEGRVRLHHADLFPARGGPWDLIVSNPPYVPAAVLAALPPEYRSEPELALASGPDGFAHLDRILAGAARHLSASGLLFVEVGALWPEVDARYARLPLTWVELEHGGEGIFVVDRAALG